MRTKDTLGQIGEELAARHLSKNGLAVLERNWRCELGEIDIVARDGDTLVICEVKTRRGTGYGTPLEAITYRKLSTLRRLAGRWLQEHRLSPKAIRIDVVAVLFSRGDEQPSVTHLRGAA